MIQKDLLTIATKFRHSLDSLKSSGKLPKILNSFPNGTCGTVTDSFIYYLKTKYDLEAETLRGTFKGCSHTWCKIDDIYIDLTADQFNRYNFYYNKIIVCHQDEYPLNKHLENIHLGISIFHPTANRNEVQRICETIHSICI